MTSSSSPSTSPEPDPFVNLAKPYAVLLTTHKRDGTGVGTPVSLAVEGDHAYFRTPGSAWKAKRIRNNPEVQLAPATVRGKPTGPEIHARARLLDHGTPEDKHAAKLLRRKHPFLQGMLVPLAHKAMRTPTLHYEVRPVDGNENRNANGNGNGNGTS